MAMDDASINDLVKRVHDTMGHPGVRRTLYFVKRVNSAVTRREVHSVVTNCQECQSIDPAPVKWRKGSLGVDETWKRVGMDVTHYGGRSCLPLIDCGPSRFALWRPLRLQTSASIIQQLEAVFFERGAPEELLTDNDTAFRSKIFSAFTREWGVHIRFRCAHVPSGNGVVERCHRSIKVIAARKGCSVAEAVYLYNLMPKDDCATSTAPANMLYRYTVRI
ncbi:Intracisternal A-particle Pol-related polyprotein [Chionoecetes opilio]|uniref:RNA-directed DNA polymerase n=1 Tax=Chionoecetes opilio TaxID=41210 RepID=A0A8J4XWN2_CHIOP|nr:Intracisternal A-particle Pol-related polyprotein [Chionoecetes opilio]